jgi:hypothetical protein
VRWIQLAQVLDAMAGRYQHGNEHSVYVICMKFLDQLMDYMVLKKFSAVRSYLIM